MSSKKFIQNIYPREIEEIDQLNPKLQDDSALVFKELIETQIRMTHPETNQILAVIEKLTFEIYWKEQNGQLEFYKISIESDQDVFFSYQLILDQHSIEQVQEMNNLNWEIDRLCQQLIKTLQQNNIKKDSYLITFQVNQEGKEGILSIFQNI